MKRKSPFAVAVFVGLVAAVWGCASDPPPPPSAIASSDGIVVELRLDRDRVRIGERVVAVVRVANEGTATPNSEQNICMFGPARTDVWSNEGELPGLEWANNSAEFKRVVLGTVGLAGGRPIGTFQNARTYDLLPLSCPGHSDLGPFTPGTESHMQLIWQLGDDSLGRLIEGPAIVRSTFRSSIGEISAETLIEVEQGSGSADLGLVELVDIALADETFKRWLESGPEFGWMPLVTYWPNPQGQFPPIPEYSIVRNPVVEIGLTRSTATHDDYGAVIIETGSGIIVGTRFEP